MTLVYTAKVGNKIHKNAGSLLEGPVIARIRRPIAKIGLCSIQNKGSCFSKGNIDDGINENGLILCFLASALFAPCLIVGA